MSHASSSQTDTTAPILLAVRPRYGYLVHAVRDQQDWRERMALGRLVIYARPLCALGRAHRGSLSQHLIVGGFQNPTQVMTALEDTSSPCEACARKVAALTEEHGALPAPAPVQQDRERIMLGAA